MPAADARAKDDPAAGRSSAEGGESGERRLTQRFWDDVSLRQLLPLAAGVFCLFGALGFLVDAMQHGRSSLVRLALLVLLSGGVAVGYLIAGVRRRYRLLAAVAALQVAGILILLRLAPEAAAAPALLGASARVALDVIAMLAALAGGYMLLMTFIAREGLRRVRTRVEIELAQRIHAALVPDVSLTNDWCEIHGRSVPATEVGGDLVDALLVGGRPLAFVADVSGHGVAAGAAMGVLKAAVRMRLRTSGDPDYILADVNDVLVQLVPENTFATAALVTLERPTRLAYALAGHPPILHWRRSSRALSRLGEGALPLGIRSGERYSVEHAEVGAGDLLAVLTDGFGETTDAAGRELGGEPLERTLAEHAEEPLAEIGERLLQLARSHGPQRDDRTLLLIRIR